MPRSALLSPDAPTLTTRAHQQLRRSIIEGRYPGGHRLRLDAVQKDLGLSSTPVREALIRLTSEGFVQLDDGRGFRVAPATLEELADITRIRLILEKEAFAESIEKGNDEWEAGVVASYQRLVAVERRSKDVIPSLGHDWSVRHSEFHTALRAGCTSPGILAICEAYFERSERYRFISAVNRSRPSKKLSEHAKLMQLALDRKKAEALALMKAHIWETHQQVLAALQDAKPRDC